MTVVPIPRRIAVIGAGAAGLVSSRHLLQCGLRPCIFERSGTLGGAWNTTTTTTTTTTNNNKMWNTMIPNLSKYTCCFSDVPWSTIMNDNNNNKDRNRHDEAASASAFPSCAHDVHQYLKHYGTTFIDPSYFKFGCTVINVRRCNHSGSSSSSNNINDDTSNDDDDDDERNACNKGNLVFQQRYQVEWTEEEQQHDDGAGTTTTCIVTKSEEFDGVIVATGFFSVPIVPKGLTTMMMNNMNMNEQQQQDDDISNNNNVIHSSQYKSSHDFVNQTVAVVGGSFSAFEIAADVRKAASHVISIVPSDTSIPWVLPRYVRLPPSHPDDDDDNDTFVPLDVMLYRRNHDGPQIPSCIAMDETSCIQRHEVLQSLSGRHKQVNSALGIPTDFTNPPTIVISDEYLNLVIDGHIDVVRGRVVEGFTSPPITINTENIDDDDDHNKKLRVQLDDGRILSDIDGIISCTGYRSQLNFLESGILGQLDYDEMDGYAPLTLCYDAFHPAVPGLGFVGMYRGPYFGIMELQARLIAGMMSGRVSPSDEDMSAALNESQCIRSLSKEKNRRAQFPRFDYVGMMDTLADQVDLVPNKEFGAKGMMVAPAFYQPSEQIARQCKKELARELGTEEKSNDVQTNDGKEGGSSSSSSANVAKIALSALVGKWRFDRTITQFSSNSDPPQHVTGQITFSYIQPALDGRQEWNTVLYDENGIFHLPGGKEMEVFRKYEYEYKDDGVLEIYFVEFDQRAHLFLSLKFARQEDGYWVATNDHLCIKDLYKATFKIKFDGVGASDISMAYRVKGPNKDYESVTHLRPL